LLLGRLLGLVWYYLIPFRRGVALSNVRRSVGRDWTPRACRRLVRRCFQRQGMYVMEVLRLPGLTDELGRELVEWQNYELFADGLAKGKGVILVAAHIDNIDLAGCAMGLRGLPVAVVAKTVGWGSAAKFIVRVREATGMTLLPPRKSKDRIRELLARNHVVGLIVDQHIKRRHAIVCRFFDQLASTTHAPARIAAETGAELVTGVVHRKGMSGHHVGRLEPFELESPFEDAETNVRHNTERINRIVEGWIREFPEQWLWPHLRWKVHDDPKGWDIPEDLRRLVDR
jgi:KDO2-lipid IV(A) lauroyltransferase